MKSIIYNIAVGADLILLFLTSIMSILIWEDLAQTTKTSVTLQIMWPTVILPFIVEVLFLICLGVVGKSRNQK